MNGETSQLVEAIRETTKAQNALTRERCLGAVDSLRQELKEHRRETGREMEDLREENSRDHAAVVERLERIENKFTIPGRAVARVLAAGGVGGTVLAWIITRALGG